MDSYCIVHLPEKTHNNAQFFKNEMVDKLVDKENVHFVYMYIYIEVPITFVSMGYEQRNWPTCERNLVKATQNL